MFIFVKCFRPCKGKTAQQRREPAMAFSSWFSLFLLGLMYRTQLVVAQQDDRSTMLALKEELLVPGWGPDESDFCSWAGVRCSSNGSTVEILDLSHRQLRELEFLDFSSNKFGSSIPPELGSARNLQSLNLSNNFLTGRIPDELQSLKRLHDLQISGNKLNGSIPYWVGNLSNLRVFAAYENELSGKIPENLGSSSEIRLLNLHSNHLGGTIPESIFALGKLEVLVLTMNKLTGNLPESIGNCKGLSSVRIGNNSLIGNIPKAIGNVSSLAYFEADNNNLSGEIVPAFGQCSNLTLLNLAFNGFTGMIPPELGELMNLQELIVSGNSLFGDIPKSLFKCRSLNKLDLSNNRFNGTIPEDICNTPRLQYLILSQNSIRGEIPREIGNCLKLLALQMGSNYLTGSIPPEIGQIKNLQIALNLSFNHLHGPLPSELGKLDKLVSLDVSSNQLSGNIPSAFKGMMSLIAVNFSNNQLTGQVPAFAPFQKSPKSSFSGNKGLCGEPLGSSCGGSFGPIHEGYHHKTSYKIILAVIGSGLTVFLTVTIVVALFMMREKQENAAKHDAGIADVGTTSPPTIVAGNVFVENLRQAIDFDAAVKATLKDSNELSTGTFSTAYKAVMPSGLILLVKRLKSIDRTVIHHQNKMIRELERLGKLCHDNLMRPIGFIIYEDVALLLHEYLSNGTLAQLLHDSTVKTEYKPDWPTRLSIAIGVAEGLAFLHHVAIIHLDISSSNILLDANSKPLVGEIEISKLLDPSKGTASISAVAGSFGYIPPEYAYTMQVTAPGNVYSYGVVLLEILTTRLPVDEAFGEGVDLVKWVHGAPARGETPEQILDARLSTVSFAWRKEMLALLKVALLCTDSIPAKRPKMKKVVEMLQEIKQS
ncbi:PREDICTED: leucine-rich repeat receptor-like tyrosine-protein kinase PXC3 isoform X2 [Nelumbo nucifera]|uniref:Leucine-rich repeat receptor-like tyrosine-protein kinase PXC3 isoform X2 n=1 Tax=Nelumbo nucifera TaxID=4432 RepID=A0A1U7Z203_NELNU|nr:PREDICTED: leucine-rich repeat receptor-like tyrosine-protein kinase PXC3 isoform X2 [Nelumbo nucifera]